MKFTNESSDHPADIRLYTIQSLPTYLFNFSCYHSPSYGAWWQKDWPPWYFGNVLARFLFGLSHCFSVCSLSFPKIPAWFTLTYVTRIFIQNLPCKWRFFCFLGELRPLKLQILSVWASFADMNYLYEFNFTLGTR